MYRCSSYIYSFCQAYTSLFCFLLLATVHCVFKINCNKFLSLILQNYVAPSIYCSQLIVYQHNYVFALVQQSRMCECKFLLQNTYTEHLTTCCLLNVSCPCTNITHLCMEHVLLHSCMLIFLISSFISVTCESHKGETSLQVIFQMLPVKELLSVPVIHQVQPHLLWTIDYTVRIASRLAKKDLQKVNHIFTHSPVSLAIVHEFT